MAVAVQWDVTSSSSSALRRKQRIFPSQRLPGSLRHALPGDIALPGEPFDSIDVYVKGRKRRRDIFVWNIGTPWIVAMEQGGIALRAAIFTYDLGKDGKAVLIDESMTFPESACAAAAKLLERRNQIGRGK